MIFFVFIYVVIFRDEEDEDEEEEQFHFSLRNFKCIAVLGRGHFGKVRLQIAHCTMRLTRT